MHGSARVCAPTNTDEEIDMQTGWSSWGWRLLLSLTVILVAADVSQGQEFVQLLTEAQANNAELLAAEQTDEAGLAAQRARIEAQTSERVSAFLVDLFRVADPGESRGEEISVRELLDRYAAASEHVKVEFIDPDREPIKTRQLAEELAELSEKIELEVLDFVDPGQ